MFGQDCFIFVNQSAGLFNAAQRTKSDIQMFIAITHAILFDVRTVCDFSLTHGFKCSAMILLEMILRYIAVGNANKFWSKSFHRLECLLIFLTFIGTSVSYLTFSDFSAALLF